MTLRQSRSFFPAQIAPRIRRRHSRSSVFVSSDPKSLTPEVCPFTGHFTSSNPLPTDENNLPITFLFSFNVNYSSCGTRHRRDRSSTHSHFVRRSDERSAREQSRD